MRNECLKNPALAKGRSALARIDHYAGQDDIIFAIFLLLELNNYKLSIHSITQLFTNNVRLIYLLLKIPKE